MYVNDGASEAMLSAGRRARPLSLSCRGARLVRLVVVVGGCLVWLVVVWWLCLLVMVLVVVFGGLVWLWFWWLWFWYLWFWWLCLVVVDATTRIHTLDGWLSLVVWVWGFGSCVFMVLVLWLWRCGVVVVVFWWSCLMFLWILRVVLVVVFRGRSRCRLVATTKTYHWWPQPPSLSRSHGPAHNAHRTTPDKAVLFAHKHPPPCARWPGGLGS